MRDGSADVKGAIRAKALELGFHAIGFAPAHLGPEAKERLAAFLAAGQHGEMAWMEDRAEQRSHPQALWPQARGVICLGLSYAPDDDPLAVQAQRDRGGISVYARNRDYHDVIKGMLKHLAAFVASRFGPAVKVFVDTAPVMEKPLAQQAGLGWQGKHTNLVSRAHGSWLLLGEIMTTMAFEAEAEADHCGTCTRCIAACPTNAFPAPYRLDATRCISYLTIEHAGPIPHPLRPLMGNRIYGCDDCLAVCPWNRFAQDVSPHPKLIARDDLRAPGLSVLAGLDDGAFRRMFSGGPVKRIGRNRFVRNVLIAIGNSMDAGLLPSARALLADPDPVVAEAADWAVKRLQSVGVS